MQKKTKLFFASLIAAASSLAILSSPPPNYSKHHPDEQAPRQAAPSATTPHRSTHWPSVRNQFLKQNPTCLACGSTQNLNVHHIIPFHINPKLELNHNNLITLCRQHHLTLGHDTDGPLGPLKPNWSAFNKNVKADALALRKKLNPKHW